MTTITALIPRIRYRTARVVAIRCTGCRTWRKPRHFDRNAGTCRACSHSAAHRRITARADRRG
jgi:hypothetical protein